MSEVLTPEQVARREDLVRELRFGDREQTTGVLRRVYPDGNVAFCGLGVACDMRQTEGYVWDHDGLYEATLPYGGVWDATPPDAVAAEFGLTDQEMRQIVVLNDGAVTVTNPRGETAPFEVIADHIEKWTIERKGSAVVAPTGDDPAPPLVL